MADQRDHDRAVLLELGRAVAQAQELERVMTRVLEAREYNLADPLDDRWEQVHWWSWRNAGRLRSLLDFPDAIADELEELIDRRNDVVHRGWLAYCQARDHFQGAAEAAPDWCAAIKAEGVLMGHACAALDELRTLYVDGGDVTDAGVVQVWRKHVPTPIKLTPTTQGLSRRSHDRTQRHRARSDRRGEHVPAPDRG
jgi:hypothetical protein